MYARESLLTLSHIAQVLGHKSWEFEEAVEFLRSNNLQVSDVVGVIHALGHHLYAPVQKGSHLSRFDLRDSPKMTATEALGYLPKDPTEPAVPGRIHSDLWR